MTMTLCPCGSGQPYADCCQPYHRGRPAPTPEALMRSRYSAYATGDVGYIMRTTHPLGPHFRPDTAVWRKDLEKFCRQTTFLRLEILSTAKKHVTFRAILLQNGRDASFIENSRFERLNGRWLYYSGQSG